MRKSICAVLVLLFVMALAAGNSGQGVVHAGTDSATLNAIEDDGHLGPSNFLTSRGMPNTRTRLLTVRGSTARVENAVARVVGRLFNIVTGRAAPSAGGYAGLHYSLFD